MASWALADGGATGERNYREGGASPEEQGYGLDVPGGLSQSLELMIASSGRGVAAKKTTAVIFTAQILLMR